MIFHNSMMMTLTMMIHNYDADFARNMFTICKGKEAQSQEPSYVHNDFHSIVITLERTSQSSPPNDVFWTTYPPKRLRRIRHMEKGNNLSNRFGTSFLVNLNFQDMLHQKLTYPRKINGWKMKFRFEMVPFLVDISIFARCSFILNHSKSIFCSMPCNLAGKSLSSSEECTPEGGSCSYMRDGSFFWPKNQLCLADLLGASPFLSSSSILFSIPAWICALYAGKAKMENEGRSGSVAGPVFLSLLLTQLLQKCRSPLFSAFPRVFFFS